MKSKSLLWVLVLILIGIGGYFLINNQKVDDTMIEDDLMMDESDTMMEDNESMSNEDTSDDSMMMEVDESAVSIDLTGKPFEFSTKEIRVKQGDVVTINFDSTLGFHDWVIDEFDARTKQVNPGEKTSVTFVADQAGTFEYYCSVGNHRAQGMVGSLIVE